MSARSRPGGPPQGLRPCREGGGSVTGDIGRPVVRVARRNRRPPECDRNHGSSVALPEDGKIPSCGSSALATVRLFSCRPPSQEWRPHAERNCLPAGSSGFLGFRTVPKYNISPCRLAVFTLQSVDPRRRRRTRTFISEAVMPHLRSDQEDLCNR